MKLETINTASARIAAERAASQTAYKPGERVVIYGGILATVVKCEQNGAGFTVWVDLGTGAKPRAIDAARVRRA